jgi:sigma-B regulation protein RsbU (phosphoserine phosphatase)
MRDPDGNITGAVLVIQDITEQQKLRRQIEEALEREKYFSRLLQRALLPGVPAIGHGYDIAVEYRPAFESREVGGDFYDVFDTAEGCVGILIGDVSGKGLESASIAAATRSTIRAFAYETSSAADALTRANTVMYRQIDAGLFVTVFLAVLNLSTGHVRYAGAGHPPAIVRKAGGEVRMLNIGLPPVAILDGIVYVEDEVYLEPGDKLITYTDGISEAKHGVALFGTEGIEAVLRDRGHLPARDLAAAITTEACRWAGEKLTDDAAVVLVERTK